MSQNGKGDKRRPAEISQDEYDRRYDQIFGKKSKHWPCRKCGESVSVQIDHDHEYCCGGWECGCRGMETNPVFCESCDPFKASPEFKLLANKLLGDETWHCNECDSDFKENDAAGVDVGDGESGEMCIACPECYSSNLDDSDVLVTIE